MNGIRTKLRPRVRASSTYRTQTPARLAPKQNRRPPDIAGTEDLFHPHYPAGNSPFTDLHLTGPAHAASLSAPIDAILTSFAVRNGNGKWPNLPRARIAQRLTILAKDPSKPDQANLNACGPAAITHLFIKRKPEPFARFATNLYDNGQAAFGNLSVSGEGLFNKDPAKMDWQGNMPELAEWMIFSALRRSMDNMITFGGEPDDNFSAITLPGDMEEWARNGVGYSRVRNEANKFFNKSLSHLTAFQPSPDLDIILLINVSGIEGRGEKMQMKKRAKSKGIPGKVEASFPNHWCVLEKPVEKIGSDLRARVWTWGQSNYLLDAPESVWEDHYYGAVICEV